MDYGCGHGGDLDRLRTRGFACVGWDPNHRQSGARRRSGVVNLGYVVNVIEDASERNEALRAAWALAEHVLVVAARLKADLGESEPGEAFADGRLTRLQTFQKFYDQQELRAWINGFRPPASPQRQACFMCSGVKPGARPIWPHACAVLLRRRASPGDNCCCRHTKVRLRPWERFSQIVAGYRLQMNFQSLRSSSLRPAA